MGLNKSYGVISFILSIVGIILLYVSYWFAPPTPSSNDKIVIGLFFFTAVGSMIASIVFGILSKEKGFLKYGGMLVVLLLVLGIISMPLLMALFGFAP